ncbi:unnamed protein product [Darwinula stevensoni]|uniref:Uncharacterized protein n=1 Tax=Darwinula stevensoni TaxID=69355 RepID=A0A7R8XK23_9CRUS|nr:unnamed protein product [Darwinula stevensoni]CAG0894772.1 unnamed protein product [Darwinula stevensoni]
MILDEMAPNDMVLDETVPDIPVPNEKQDKVNAESELETIRKQVHFDARAQCQLVPSSDPNASGAVELRYDRLEGVGRSRNNMNVIRTRSCFLGTGLEAWIINRQRKAFLETRQALEVKLVIEEQTRKQDRARTRSPFTRPDPSLQGFRSLRESRCLPSRASIYFLTSLDPLPHWSRSIPPGVSIPSFPMPHNGSLSREEDPSIEDMKIV